MPPLTNFVMPPDLNQDFEAKIKSLNQKAGRGPVLLHGDKTRYILDAIREWIAKE
jgi:hypothetical protein